MYSALITRIAMRHSLNEGVRISMELSTCTLVVLQGWQWDEMNRNLLILILIIETKKSVSNLVLNNKLDKNMLGLIEILNYLR